MDKHVLEPFIKKEDIAVKVKELGEKITRDFKGEKVLLVGVLKGAWMFLSDLSKNIDLDVEISFISVSSYVGEKTTTSGVVRLMCDIDRPLEGKNLILVEDIVDTGLTLNYLKKLLSVRKPKSISICTLLDKPSRRVAPINPDYSAFEIPDEFVVGYGLDFNNRYRNLPEIYKLIISEDN
ncbi:hypoxanthine phosphoribosyltransferase [Deferribacterales bacterium Es71-Z0220]|uniref:hypoxanthine phosphoribosyltransferase n=1 Tax=Deferrivibrio essentukiensis TaxID=2880922 RepID=UPI001F6213E8|nr:hypoxanthine phosphoribosyltransferase [Deferrivibrio essentukiensis]MCB4204512.1 hypoxanthine phosphoribosyltransferase [Deferrivibrio essentukiensis]